MSVPMVSVVIPTLNSARHLDRCLGALLAQDHPRDRLELLVIDAGSTDGTREIAERLGVDRVLENPLRTAEAGKAVGIHAAEGELICSVDSDNVVIGSTWLSQMIAPFEDPEVIASESLRWEYERSAHPIDRWHALSAVSDPLSLHIGNYDHVSALTGRWTDYPHRSEPRDGWDRVTIDPRFVPTMGANGFVVRRSAFDVVPVGDYHFDIDFVHDLVQAGHAVFGKVDVAVRHYFCDSFAQFVKKTRRRADDFFFFADEGRRTYPWTSRQRAGIVDFALSTALTIPVAQQALRGHRREPDAAAWLFHVVACWVTLVVYATSTVRGKLAPKMLDRKGWQQ